MMRIAITGASGLVGRGLVPFLRAAGHDVVRLVRRSAAAADELQWQPETGMVDADGLRRCAAVVHLAGANLADGRWTPVRKRVIRDSRVIGTETLARFLAADPLAPRVWVSASAVGFYGSRGDEWLDETTGPGSGFLAEVCQEWERATLPATAAGVRVVNLRLGVVLAKNGGVLGKTAPAFRWGAGAVLGDGRNWMSWIGEEDLYRIVLWALSDSEIHGPVNAVAPWPVESGEFARRLGQLLRRPVVLRVPGALVKLVFGEMAEGTVLASHRVRPTVLERAGFGFRDRELRTTIGKALELEL
jgi:uncharacterized protein